jgi:integrase
VKLNDRTVTAASPALPAGKADAIFFDEDCPGFGLRVRAAGSRVFVYQYSLGDRSRRMTLGAFPKITARKARELVEGLAAKVALGDDPQGVKFENRAARESVGEVVDLFLAAQAKRLRPRSLIEVERHLTSHARPLHGLPVAKLDRRSVAELLTGIAANSGPSAANRVRASLSTLFNWSIRQGFAETNPAAFTDKQAEQSRERVLSATELKAIWAALPATSHYSTIVKLLLLTGQRRAEIGGLRWSEIDLERNTITLPAERTKNKRKHTISVSAPVRALLVAMPRTEGRDLVFGSGTAGFSDWAQSKERLDKACGVRDWTLHDLRRTAATMMCESGVQPHIVEQILNHVNGHKGGVAGTYNRASYCDQVREALTLWGNRVAEICQ